MPGYSSLEQILKEPPIDADLKSGKMTHNRFGLIAKFLQIFAKIVSPISRKE